MGTLCSEHSEQKSLPHDLKSLLKSIIGNLVVSTCVNLNYRQYLDSPTLGTAEKMLTNNNEMCQNKHLLLTYSGVYDDQTRTVYCTPYRHSPRQENLINFCLTGIFTTDKCILERGRGFYTFCQISHFTQLSFPVLERTGELNLFPSFIFV